MAAEGGVGWGGARSCKRHGETKEHAHFSGTLNKLALCLAEGKRTRTSSLNQTVAHKNTGGGESPRQVTHSQCAVASEGS